MSRDRRIAPRFPVILVAEIAALPLGPSRSGRTSDISRTGCYMDSLKPFASGTRVRIKLTRANETFETLATVVYANSGLGMGIHFDDNIEPGQLDVLNRWLEAFEHQAH